MCFLCEVLDLTRDLSDVLFVRDFHHRHHQSVIRVHGDTNIEISLDHDLFGLVHERRSEIGVLLERFDDCLDDVGHKRHVNAFLRVVTLAHLRERSHVSVVHVRYVDGTKSRSREVFRYGLAHASQRYVFHGAVEVVLAADLDVRHGVRSVAGWADVTDVLLGDAAVLAATMDGRQVDAQFFREAARRGCCIDGNCVNGALQFAMSYELFAFFERADDGICATLRQCL